MMIFRQFDARLYLRGIPAGASRSRIRHGVGPILGILIGVFAMVCDVYTIRRFFIADHKWRWPVATIAVSVMSLLAVLLVQDIAHLIQN